MELLNKIQKELQVGKTLFNKFGGYKYRSAEQILEGVKPLLGKGTLTLSDDVVLIGQRYYVKSTATLTDGGESVSVSAYARETEVRKGMDDAQVTGATSSYSRKYALNGLFCLNDVQEPDDVDNTGSGEKQTPPVPRNATPPSSVKQEAQQAQAELVERFEQSLPKPTKRPTPTAAERNVLHVLSEYWVTLIKSPNIKLDGEKILDVTFSLLGHYPTLDDCLKIKDSSSPFFISLEKITRVVA
jgi:hypothetical protein